jgi:prepilin-type N-terminal cleavage/methylation domain-containing protein
MTLGKEPALNRRRNTFGFSLIEILVVIGLIAVLSTMLLIGISKLQTNSKRQQTKLVFQNLSAMYSEWDALNHLHISSYADPGIPGSDNVPCPGNVTDACPVPNPFASPPVKADDSTLLNRYGQAVWQTRDIMALLTAVPTNTAALGKISSGTLMTFPAYLDGNDLPIIPSPYYEKYSGAPAFSPLNGYQPAVSAANAGSANTFATLSVASTFTTQICLFRSIRPNPTPSVAPPDTSFWMAAGSVTVQNATKTVTVPYSGLKVPVFVDGWGNPIIFVTGGALGSGATLPTDAQGSGPFPMDAQGLGILRAGGNSTVVQSPDGRPFWASAGPDGDFSKGDDNMYSFEK